jgi:voltage-gated potassium channel
MSDGGPNAIVQAGPTNVLPARLSRRMIALALLRSAGVVTSTLIVYALIPIREQTALAIGASAVLGLVVVAVVFVRQVRRISSAASPISAALEALALVLGMFVSLFAFVYASLDALALDSFTQPVDKVAAVYFSVAVLATVGFGDVAAVSDMARILVTIQMVLDLVLIGAAVKVLGASARRAVDARLENQAATRTGGATSTSETLDTLPEQAEDLEGRT